MVIIQSRKIDYPMARRLGYIPALELLGPAIRLWARLALVAGEKGCALWWQRTADRSEFLRCGGRAFSMDCDCRRLDQPMLAVGHTGTSRTTVSGLLHCGNALLANVRRRLGQPHPMKSYDVWPCYYRYNDLPKWLLDRPWMNIRESGFLERLPRRGLSTDSSRLMLT